MCRFPGLKRGHGIFGGLVPAALFSEDGLTVFLPTNKRKKKQKKAEGMEDENKRQLKRTRQQQKQENAEEKHEGSKLRSGKIRKINSVELSLSSRCRDAPD